MFYFGKINDIEYTSICHSENVFHEAIKLGKTNYFVKNSEGSDYYINYVKNNNLLPDYIRALKSEYDIYPDYKNYDENNIDDLDLSLLKKYKKIYFKGINEYSIVLAKIIIKYLGLNVLFNDEFIYNFISKNDNISIIKNVEHIENEDTLNVEYELECGIWGRNFKKISSMPLFHTVFFWQSFNKDLSKIKYASISYTNSTGIGGMLSYYSNVRNMFLQKNIKTYLCDEASRFSKKVIDEHFNFERRPNDSTDDNTIYINDVTFLVVTYNFKSNSKDIDRSIISENYLNKLDYESNKLLNNKKTLGLIIRGTDYLISNFSGSRKMATVDEMLPLIKEYYTKFGYEQIFIATEDDDILERMVHEFGDKIIYLNQIRFRVSDFGEQILLYQLEKDKMEQDEIDNNMLIYFKALYILSKCDGLIASGVCHGLNIVNALNGGEFKNYYKFKLGK